MATPFLAGLAVAGAALAGRYGIQAWQAFKARPPKPKMRKFYDGGFQPSMTRREAALILGLRENASPDKVKEAHRRVMVANHPDAGGRGQRCYAREGKGKRICFLSNIMSEFWIFPQSYINHHEIHEIDNWL